MKSSIPEPNNPFQWQDDNDRRYESQQREIDCLNKKVNVLMECVALLMNAHNSKSSGDKS
jgi:hypothetical protein